MDSFDFIPKSIFELIGLITGVMGWTAIAYQAYNEFRSTKKSSLSLTFLLGFACIYGFMCLYGIRFQAKALVLINGIAAVLQFSMFVIVVFKNKQFAKHTEDVQLDLQK